MASRKLGPFSHLTPQGLPDSAGLLTLSAMGQARGFRRQLLRGGHSYKDVSNIAQGEGRPESCAIGAIAPVPGSMRYESTASPV